MEIDKERQQRAQENARKIIEEAERVQEARRISRGAAEFERGNFEILRNNELVTNLANYIFSLLSSGRAEDAALLLQRLGESARCSDVELRERSVMALSFLIGQILEKENLDALEPLSKLLVEWLQFETVYISGFPSICKQIQQIGQLMLDRRLFNEAESLLVIIYQIQSGILEKGNTIRGMLAKIQDNIASREILEILVDEYLLDEEKKLSSVDNILVYLGRRAVIFLLNKLMHSDSRRDRFLLMRLIPVAGNVAVPVLVECLKKNPPWYVVRNIIYIIAEMGDPSLYSMVQPYLKHKDIRVQQEVINCINRLDGSKMKPRLLEALMLVDDELKLSLVVHLAQLGGDDVEEALHDLLAKRGAFGEQSREELVVRIIGALKKFPSQKSARLLRLLVASYSRDPAHVRIAGLAQEALLALEPKLRRLNQNVQAGDEIAFDDDPKEMTKAATKMRKFEEEIASFVKVGDLEKACQKIYNHCVAAAREKDFLTAEMLRDRLLEINPMALSEVIRAGEIIEEEKSSSITSNHLKIWGDLYEKMTTEEFTAMYYALRLEKYHSDDVIVRSGETDTSLYFLNSGFVGIYCNHGSQEVFLKRMQPGDILGVEQFFSVSIWTVTLKAQSEVQIHVLDRDMLAGLQNSHPGLESKLQDYCMKFDIVPDLVRMAGSDRREFPRYPVSLIINNMLLDPFGQTGKKTFRGEMIDISRGGLGFSIRISNKDNARLLLGRQIVTEIDIGKGEKLRCAGMIVSVRFHHVVELDFSVHVKLFKKLEQSVVMSIVNQSVK